jgi:hypothetical protein
MVNQEWKNILEDSESNIVIHIQELLKKKFEELRKYIEEIRFDLGGSMIKEIEIIFSTFQEMEKKL